MAKKSRNYTYLGRMNVLNRENIAKRLLDTEKSKVQLKLEHEYATSHKNKGEKTVYEEDQHTACSCKKCGCK